MPSVIILLFICSLDILSRLININIEILFYQHKAILYSIQIQKKCLLESVGFIWNYIKARRLLLAKMPLALR